MVFQPPVADTPILVAYFDMARRSKPTSDFNLSSTRQAMSSACLCGLDIENGEAFNDIALHPTTGHWPSAILESSSTSHAISGVNLLPEKVSLRFLSVVETAQIPLHLILGPRYALFSAEQRVERWFRSILLGASSAMKQNSRRWWQSAALDSPLGILVAVDQTTSDLTRSTSPRVTELLFYASKVDDDKNSIEIHATLLSSELLCQAPQPTPPASPLVDNGEVHAVFLPPPVITRPEIIHELKGRKRKTVTDTFDEATERRQKARRQGGEGVSAAAASKTTDSLPTLKHCRSGSGTANGLGNVHVQTRPLSRSPSLSGSYQIPPLPRTTGSVEPGKRSSSLSLVQAAPALASEESKNKDLISRIVMAGMRLYGLSQSRARANKSRQPLATTTGGMSHALDASTTSIDSQAETARAKDDEYKLIYHQVFKGVCFAFRTHIHSPTLSLHSNALRDMVDRLLNIFCSDPLQMGSGSAGVGNEVTPGGRKAFGAAGGVELASPFAGLSGFGGVSSGVRD
ncbi:Hypothetical protein R9X50_00403500 [Acrodontium crateriforme]|uniref:Sld7 C-terminal domain-containing protein n=1 Tax=Acrodontium crateriforme TaxID=150365 RepID=A0AAQ3R805_9PEZI|nr:Hypothetical protein R9X50_00403500 [Acrodontium crateriforme]